MVIDRFVKKVT